MVPVFKLSREDFYKHLWELFQFVHCSLKITVRVKSQEKLTKSIVKYM